MKVRYTKFVGKREISTIESGHTVRVQFELPHRMMLCNLSRLELFNLSEQCEELLSNPGKPPTIYLGSVDCIEEVRNETS